MIATLHGTLIAHSGTRVIVDVGGVGFSVWVTERHGRSLRTGDQAQFHTALIVREDDLSLFGFVDVVELSVFELLRTVSGVGPKSALGVLGVMTASDIARAIAEGDDAPFRAVGGIGPKTAKLIVVSLAGKLIAPALVAGHESGASSSENAGTVDSLAAALTGLGWPERTALDAARNVVGADLEATLSDLPVLLRRALALLGSPSTRPATVDEGRR